MVCGCPTLRHFGNAAVGIALGLGGQAVLWKSLATWQPLADLKPMLEAVQWVLYSSCLVTWLGFLATYAAKARCHWDVINAEARHPMRVNFFMGPNIVLCMLGLALPADAGDQKYLLQVLWCFALCFQLGVSLIIYHRWLYLSRMNETAAAPWLLSVVTWFLLVVLGEAADIDESGVPLRSMCFGVGAFFALLVYPLILFSIYEGRTGAGTPALFLTLAPLSVAGLGLRVLGAPAASEALLGLVLFLFLFWLRGAPQLFQRPAVLGTYWAYVFPVAAMATLAIAIAKTSQTIGANALAAACTVLAVLAFLVVLSRMSAHLFTVARGKSMWTDPVVVALDSKHKVAPAESAGESKADAVAGAKAAPEGAEQDIKARMLQLEELVGRQQEAIQALKGDMEKCQVATRNM